MTGISKVIIIVLRQWNWIFFLFTLKCVLDLASVIKKQNKINLKNFKGNKMRLGDRTKEVLH